MRGDSLTGRKWLWMVGSVFNREVNITMILISLAYSIKCNVLELQGPSPVDEIWPDLIILPGHWLSMSDLQARQGDVMATYAHDL